MVGQEEKDRILELFGGLRLTDMCDAMEVPGFRPVCLFGY